MLHRIVGSNFDTMLRELCQSIVPQNSSSSLGMFNNYHQRNKARTGKGAAQAVSHARTNLCFNRGQKRMTSQASMWKLGKVHSNAKGGKFCAWSRDLVEQLAAASERVFDAKLTPEAVRQRLLPSVRQARGGDWMLKAKLPAHARFCNGRSANPAELAHYAARARLRARSLWLMSGMCGLSLEVTDLRVEPPSRECPL